MSTQYSTIQQHQPLRVPSGWSQQEKALIVQLDEILDDLYSRFNRLSMRDLGKELQTTLIETEQGLVEIATDVSGVKVRMESAEGSITVLETTAEGLSGRMSSAEGSISELSATASGLSTRMTSAEGNISTLSSTASSLTTRMSTAEGNISTISSTAFGLSTRMSTAEGNINAISATAQSLNVSISNIINGTTAVKKVSTTSVRIDGTGFSLETGNFDVNAGNFVVSSSNNYVRIRGDLQDINGHSLLNDHQIVISKTTPGAEYRTDGTIWIQPVGQLSLAYSADKTYSSTNYLDGSNTSLVCSGTPAVSSTGNYSYRLVVGINCIDNLTNTTLTFNFSNSAGTKSVAKTYATLPKSTSTLTIDFSDTSIWLGQYTPITMTITANRNKTNIRFATGKVTLTCTAIGQGQAAWVAANVFSWVA